MQIERLNNEILIRLSADTDTIGLQRLLDFLKFKEITSTSKASEEQIGKLAKSSKSDWWKKNKSRFVK
ncbi:hypothetical protein [Flagellimonas hadalis]|uniref:Uncharacterized protein n=1 Tax=Flagellimonas hadalis TaxID=2597517 RepID=A0A5N5IQA7_9FLAO|nr:hypothetical protein [Allomuricauda hadalis]KAB5484211.1 hypothetical protein FOT42_016820 [Allomuricauda hadalis]